MISSLHSPLRAGEGCPVVTTDGPACGRARVAKSRVRSWSRGKLARSFPATSASGFAASVVPASQTGLGRASCLFCGESGQKRGCFLLTLQNSPAKPPERLLTSLIKNHLGAAWVAGSVERLTRDFRSARGFVAVGRAPRRALRSAWSRLETLSPSHALFPE